MSSVTRATCPNQSSTSSSSKEDDVSQKHWNITHTQPPSSQKEDVGVEKSHGQPPGTHSHIRGQESDAPMRETRDD